MGQSGIKGAIGEWLTALVFALAYAGLAIISLATTQTSDGIAVIWPSSGILLGGLMVMKGRARLKLVALIAPLSIAVNIAFDNLWWMAAGFTFANLVEGAIAASIVLAGNRAWRRFDDPVWVVRLCVGAFLASVVSAGIATLFADTAAAAMLFGSWFAAVFLGMLIGAPATVILYRGGFSRMFDSARLLRSLVVFALGLASIAAAFLQNSYPLLFLPLAATVFATYLLGATGAIGMLLLVTIGGMVGVTQGLQPAGLDSDPVGSIYFLQFYLLTVFAAALPLATLLEKSRRQVEEIARRNTLLETAESFANVGHWRYDLATEEIEWSDEMYRIYGLDPESDTPRDVAAGAVIPEEARLVRTALIRAIETGEPFDHELSIRRADGALRYVHARGYVENSGNRSTAIFGVLKDITDHADALEKLQQARARAEREARNALLLSETDQLTGVANRRKLLSVLAREMAISDRDGRDLAIIMIDVDHFKSINDAHGHGVGDLVLQRIADAGRSCLRDDDHFGRLGGEEFLAILPGAGEALAVKIAERLRQAVNELSADPSLGLENITISLGVATHQAGADESFFLQAADGALYQSKADGRNRSSVAKASAA